MDDFAELLDDVQKPIYDSFDGHTVTVLLPSGGGEYPTLKIECNEKDREDSVCNPGECQMLELYNSIGWEVLRASGEIELGRLSAKIDWSDYEEPWIDVEP